MSSVERWAVRKALAVSVYPKEFQEIKTDSILFMREVWYLTSEVCYLNCES